MELKGDVLVLEGSVQDDQAEALLGLLHKAKAVELNTADVGGAIVQLLLCAGETQQISLGVDSPMLQAVFANPVRHA